MFTSTLEKQTDAIPSWWNIKGFKMLLACKGKALVIIENGEVAKLRIARLGKEENAQFLVSWEIHFDNISQVQGQTIMSSTDIKEAFGLIEQEASSKVFCDQVYQRKYEYDAAKPGVFIRFGKYLSIPWPRVFYCDMNIAIEINEQVTEAIENLLIP